MLQICDVLCFAALLSMILASIARIFMSLPLTAFALTSAAVLLAMSYWSSAGARYKVGASPIRHVSQGRLPSLNTRDEV